jgi:hypothetical protein
VLFARHLLQRVEHQPRELAIVDTPAKPNQVGFRNHDHDRGLGVRFQGLRFGVRGLRCTIHGPWSRVQGPGGFRVYGVRFMAHGLGFRVYGVRFMAHGLGCRVQEGSGFTVYGSWPMV